MKPRRLHELFSILIALVSTQLVGCRGEVKPRLLDSNDIGKVFVAPTIESHPNFGKYLILLSTESRDLYAFSTFDIVDGQPVGKLVVSYVAAPMYIPVEMSDDFVQKAEAACEERMAQVRHELWGPTGKPPK